MVRLLPVTLTKPYRIERFQSHNGAIAALDLTRMCVILVCFNPTMVRLLPHIHGKVVCQRKGFNPTMVRLLQYYKVSDMQTNI